MIWWYPLFLETPIYTSDYYNQGQLVNCVTAQLTIYLKVLHEQESKKNILPNGGLFVVESTTRHLQITFNKEKPTRINHFQIVSFVKDYLLLPAPSSLKMRSEGTDHWHSSNGAGLTHGKGASKLRLVLHPWSWSILTIDYSHVYTIPKGKSSLQTWRFRGYCVKKNGRILK